MSEYKHPKIAERAIKIVALISGDVRELFLFYSTIYLKLENPLW